MQDPKSDLSYSYDDLVKEISELTGLDRNLVKDRVWKEALQRGRNVYEGALKFGIDFHIYNEKMENFYRQTDSFIFETAVESCRPEKKDLLLKMGERIENYLEKKRSSGRNDPLPLLMFGDGAGDNTLYLWNRFKEEVELFYFDIPGSKTYDFAVKRFRKYKVPVTLLTDEARIPKNFFDALISLEVFEHLPDPPKTIRSLAGFLKVEGIALVSEYFEGVLPLFPTHLRSNLKFAGKTPFLFLQENLVLTYYPKRPPYFKPMEFTKASKAPFDERIKLLLEKPIFLAFVQHWIARIVRKFIR